MVTQEEADRLQRLKERQHQLFPRGGRETAPPLKGPTVRPTPTQLRADEIDALVGIVPGSGGKYPAKRTRR